MKESKMATYLPNAPSRDAEALPLWYNFVVGELALVSVATSVAGVVLLPAPGLYVVFLWPLHW